MAEARVHVLPGDAAAERSLLALVDRLLPLRGLDLARLTRPLRIVVPSRSLRLHVVRAVVAHRGRALAGLVVQTLPSLTAELLAAAGQRPRHADPVLEVLVRRRATATPALLDELGDLDDGLAAALRPVADLLDAGFVAERDAVALARLIQSLPPGLAGDDERLRALALVQVAAGVQEDLAMLGLGRHADGHRAAAALLRADPRVLPASGVILHGLVDPTGAELELVEALVTRADARVLLSAPPGPADLLAGDGLAAARSGPAGRLLERLGAAGGFEISAAPASAPQVTLSSAPGRQAEARNAARRVQQLLAQGVAPEDLAIVARDLSAWGPRLRPELERLGVPWSGVGGQAPPGPALRRLRALVELVHRRQDAALDRWLDAAVHLPGSGAAPVDDLRTAFRSLGRIRLGEVAALDLDRVLEGDRGLRLPVRTGLVDAAASDGQADGEIDPDLPAAPASVARRWVSRAALAGAVQAAGDLLAGLADDAPRPLAAWAGLLRDLAGRCLGWGDPDAAWRALVAALEALVERTSPALRLDRQEARLLLGPALEGAAVGPIGGQGGGVQLLSAVEARGRTFQHLLVVGLSRGELPRASRGDPLLPETLRGRLQGLLPDLPLAATRLEVERDLLAHLLSAAPRVELSWPSTDDDGRVVPPSPLVEHLRLALPDLPVRVLPPPGSRLDPPADLRALPRPPLEHAVQAALHGGQDELFQAAVAVAVDQARPQPGPPAAAVARARSAIRHELDAPRGRRGAGPYLGFVGPLGDHADPRAGALYVTTLEAVATCGWRAFLELVLRLEPPPDPAGQLPGIDARLVGGVVHRVLEGLGRDAMAAPGGASRLPWPDAQALAERVDQVARSIAAEEGLALAGLWRVLARRAGPYLEVARAMEQADPAGRVLAVEVEGQADLPTPRGRRTIRFRADRQDALDGGGTRLTDYKTGKPVSMRKKADGRESDLLAEVHAGRRLQAALYARSAPGETVGRYLSLRPDVVDADAPARSATVPGTTFSRQDFDAALDHAVGITIAAWESGALVPRLVDPGEQTPAACGWCGVRQACLQGDSTARMRQHAWATQATGDRAAPGQSPEPEGRALWWLGHEPDGDPADPAEGGEG